MDISTSAQRRFEIPADGVESENIETAIVCKLTSPELRERKKTVIASLKEHMLERKELENGFAYRFEGTNEMIDEITGFINTERSCCGFFRFKLLISADKEYTWLEITGEKGTKDFIKTELEM